jgi:transcriptional regulator with GAF, ATPase, and Fis domain
VWLSARAASHLSRSGLITLSLLATAIQFGLLFHAGVLMTALKFTAAFSTNIRELQDIVERSVILCTEELIEAALGETNGKVAGPNGAAVKLGIPRSTLDLKIKQLNINKRRVQ